MSNEFKKYLNRIKILNSKLVNIPVTKGLFVQTPTSFGK